MIDPELRIAAVELGVSNLARSVAFYEHVLGLGLLSAGDEVASLGSDPAHLALTLRSITSPVAVPSGSTGLFHVAWLHPSREALALTVRRIAAARWRFDGASDHGVSEALYLSDPDGLGIEIYADRPRELWERPASGIGVQMVTLPLDIGDLLEQAAEQPTPRIDAATTIGHVHMKVADVDRANAFYRDALGFEEQASIPSAAFLSAGGYHHHIGLNSWQSRGGQRAPEDAPGVRRVEFALGGGMAALTSMRESLAGAGRDSLVPEDDAERLALEDVDGQPLVFVAT